MKKKVANNTPLESGGLENDIIYLTTDGRTADDDDDGRDDRRDGLMMTTKMTTKYDILYRRV